MRALDDATIVAIFDAANTSDIETGDLGAKKGSTKAIRDFGAMLSRDHKTVRQQGRDLAKKLGVTPTPPADDESAKAHAAVLKKLNSLRCGIRQSILAERGRLSRGGDRRGAKTLLPRFRTRSSRISSSSCAGIRGAPRCREKHARQAMWTFRPLPRAVSRPQPSG
jgi:hypothetical protein